MKTEKRSLEVLDTFRKEVPAIPQLFFNTVKNAGDLPANTYRTEQEWKTISYREWAEISESIAYALMKAGAKKGDDIALLTSFNAQRAWADMAIQISGGVSTTVPLTASDEDLVYIITRADIKIVFTETKTVLQRIVAFRSQTPSLKAIVCMEDNYVGDLEFTFGLQQFMKFGQDYRDEHPDMLASRIKSITGEDLARVNYSISINNELRCSMMKQKEWTEGERSEQRRILEQALHGELSDVNKTVFSFHNIKERTFLFLALVAIGAVIQYGPGPSRIRSLHDLKNQRQLQKYVV